jgi:tripartite-type tricarboxylate transporter receptor subunit TctC
VELFKMMTSTQITHVPYKGAGPLTPALLSGEVDLAFDGMGTSAPHIKAGKLRPLAGWGAKRVAALADLPTFKELGYDIEFYIWAGMFAPTGTPEPILRKLRDTARQAVQEPDFKSAMVKLETPVAYQDAPEFQKFWDKDAKMLADAIKRVGKIEEKK